MMKYINGNPIYHMGNLKAVTTSKDGLMTATMLTKLNGIDTSADVNRPITDSISTSSSDTVASALAVKTAYDRAVSGESGALTDAKTYTDGEITTLKNEILGGASAAYDTLLEIQNELESNDTDISSILTTLDTKLSKSGGTMTGDITMGSNKIIGGATYEYLFLGADTEPSMLTSANTITIHADSNDNQTTQFLSLKAGLNELKIMSSGGQGVDDLTYNGARVLTTSDLADSGADENLEKIAYIGSDSVLEIGRYLDFHTDGSTNDFDARFDIHNADELKLVGAGLNIADGDLTTLNNINLAGILDFTATDISVEPSGTNLSFMDSGSPMITLNSGGYGIDLLRSISVDTSARFYSSESANKQIYLSKDLNFYSGVSKTGNVLAIGSDTNISFVNGNTNTTVANMDMVTGDIEGSNNIEAKGAFKTGNFEIKHNPDTDTLDFNYIGG